MIILRVTCFTTGLDHILNAQPKHPYLALKVVRVSTCWLRNKYFLWGFLGSWRHLTLPSLPFQCWVALHALFFLGCTLEQLGNLNAEIKFSMSKQQGQLTHLQNAGVKITAVKGGWWFQLLAVQYFCHDLSDNSFFYLCFISSIYLRLLYKLSFKTIPWNKRLLNCYRTYWFFFHFTSKFFFYSLLDFLVMLLHACSS